MGYNEDLARLKEKVDQLFAVGYQTDTKGMLQQTFIQILNEAEKNRQNCMNAADNFKRQASVMEGQANAFSSFASIISSVLSGYVMVAQKAREEEARHAAEQQVTEEEEKSENEIKHDMPQDHVQEKRQTRIRRNK